MPKNKSLSLKVYFQPDDEESMKVYARVERLCNKTGLSVSALVGMIIRFGVTEVEERLLEPEDVADEPKKKKSK